MECCIMARPKTPFRWVASGKTGNKDRCQHTVWSPHTLSGGPTHTLKTPHTVWRPHTLSGGPTHQTSAGRECPA